MSDARTSSVVAGPEAPITIRRDAYGIPHIQAAAEGDAWFGMGYAAAQDRLWQMEYDRRRAVGRWAEVVGSAALAADRLARRLQLGAAAHADIAAMTPPTRAMFDAYASGVNAFLAAGRPLPLEYSLTGLTPEPWEPWHSVASFKIRHVLMGTWQLKLAQAQLLTLIGPQTYARLDARPGGGVPSPTILTGPGPVRQLVGHALEDIQAAARSLGFLAEAEAGSNSWAVHGSRTTTGMPVLCNDSHRQLDVPNVYWQVQLSYPGVNVAGGAFPGVPGFPHFGHNGSVAWNITHGMADTQDLYIEQFDPGDSGRYRTPTGWDTAARHTEEIAIHGMASASVELWRTRHGPIVHGDPRRGYALALRATATDAPRGSFEALRPMLAATTVPALFATQQLWVDPVNNLVAADTAGNIGYLLRGLLPIRSSPAHRQFPVPGWTNESVWVGTVPFEQMPRALNPAEGVIVTANQRIIPGNDPYIGDAFAEPFRARRILSRLSGCEKLSPAEIVLVQGDTVSEPARSWIGLCQRVGPLTGAAEQARTTLAAWDGNLRPESGTALLYGCFRRCIAQTLFAPAVGPRAWEWLIGGEAPSTEGIVRRWLASAMQHSLDITWPAPDGRPWAALLAEALAEAWAEALRIGGPSPKGWQWAAHHRTEAAHTLAAAFPARADALNPPSVGVGGDSDTVNVAGYPLQAHSRFAVTGLPVYRQVVDLAQSERSWSVIPGGSSGSPDTAHFADQLELWRTGGLVPLRE